MKKLKCFVSVLLCLTLLLCATSCQLINALINEIEDIYSRPFKPDVEPGDWTGPSPVPEGYTGGFISNPQYHSDTGLYWLENYEEVLEALELLKAHGSIIKRRIGVGFDGEPYDVKWCFHYQRSCAEPLEEGKNFFDRKIDNGYFDCYIFRRDVTIDTLIYSYVTNYDCIKINTNTRNSTKVENTDELYIFWFGKDVSPLPYPGEPCFLTYGDVNNDLATIELYNDDDHDQMFSEELLDAILNSVVFVE